MGSQTLASSFCSVLQVLDHNWWMIVQCHPLMAFLAHVVGAFCLQKREQLVSCISFPCTINASTAKLCLVNLKNLKEDGLVTASEFKQVIANCGLWGVHFKGTGSVDSLTWVITYIEEFHATHQNLSICFT